MKTVCLELGMPQTPLRYAFCLCHNHLPGLSGLALFSKCLKGKSATSQRWAPRWAATLASEPQLCLPGHSNQQEEGQEKSLELKEEPGNLTNSSGIFFTWVSLNERLATRYLQPRTRACSSILQYKTGHRNWLAEKLGHQWQERPMGLAPETGFWNW